MENQRWLDRGEAAAFLSERGYRTAPTTLAKLKRKTTLFHGRKAAPVHLGTIRAKRDALCLKARGAARRHDQNSEPGRVQARTGLGIVGCLAAIDARENTSPQ